MGRQEDQIKQWLLDRFSIIATDDDLEDWEDMAEYILSLLDKHDNFNSEKDHKAHCVEKLKDYIVKENTEQFVDDLFLRVDSFKESARVNVHDNIVYNQKSAPSKTFVPSRPDREDNPHRRSAPAPSDKLSLYVSGIPAELNSLSVLGGHFERFGKVVNVGIREETGSAVVTFASSEAALAALNDPAPVANNRFIQVSLGGEERRRENEGGSAIRGGRGHSYAPMRRAHPYQQHPRSMPRGRGGRGGGRGGAYFPPRGRGSHSYQPRGPVPTPGPGTRTFVPPSSTDTAAKTGGEE